MTRHNDATQLLPAAGYQRFTRRRTHRKKPGKPLRNTRRRGSQILFDQFLSHGIHHHDGAVIAPIEYRIHSDFSAQRVLVRHRGRQHQPQRGRRILSVGGQLFLHVQAGIQDINTFHQREQHQKCDGSTDK